MNVRVARALEEGSLKLVKVHTCRECPNTNPKRKSVSCDLLNETIYNGDAILNGCPLPSLLEISKEIPKSA